jgi:hypothetical protein
MTLSESITWRLPNAREDRGSYLTGCRGPAGREPLEIFRRTSQNPSGIVYEIEEPITTPSARSRDAAIGVRAVGVAHRLCTASKSLEPTQPEDELVPSGAVLVHQTFISSLNRPQAAEAQELRSTLQCRLPRNVEVGLPAPPSTTALRWYPDPSKGAACVSQPSSWPAASAMSACTACGAITPG